MKLLRLTYGNARQPVAFNPERIDNIGMASDNTSGASIVIMGRDEFAIFEDFETATRLWEESLADD